MILKKYCFCVSLKTGAVITSFANVSLGLAIFIIAAIKLYHYQHPLTGIDEEGKIGSAFLWVWIIMGIYNIAMGILLLIAIIQANGRLLLLYMLLAFVDFLIINIYTIINMIADHNLIVVFIFSISLWYCLYTIYAYYLEIQDYNTTSCGVIEISYRTNGLYEPDNLPNDQKIASTSPV